MDYLSAIIVSCKAEGTYTFSQVAFLRFWRFQSQVALRCRQDFLKKKNVIIWSHSLIVSSMLLTSNLSSHEFLKCVGTARARGSLTGTSMIRSKGKSAVKYGH